MSGHPVTAGRHLTHCAQPPSSGRSEAAVSRAGFRAIACGEESAEEDAQVSFQTVVISASESQAEVDSNQ